MTARALLLVLLVLVPGDARADRREFYTLVAYEPGLARYLDAPTGQTPTTTYQGGVELLGYYGLTNSIHVGLALHATQSSDIHFANLETPLPDGSISRGDLYENHLALGAAALALYRLDTGRPLAPAVELQAGFTTHRYSQIAHVPAGASYGVGLPNVSETVFQSRATVLLEYRIADRWLAAVGLALQYEPGGLNPWVVTLPLRVGVIWW